MLDITTARAAGDRGAQLALDFAVRGGFDFEGACKFVRSWLVRHGPTAGEVLVLANGSSFCRMGSAKAAVLPVPVCAPAIRSQPSSTIGMACAWMGVGVR